MGRIKIASWFVLIVMVSVFSLCRPLHATARHAPDFSLSLSKVNPAIDDEFNVIVKGSSLSDLYAYEINIAYDKTKLQLDTCTVGNDGFTLPPIMTNDGLQLAHTETGNKPGLAGSADLATLTFKALHKGKTDITLVSIKQVDSRLESAVYSHISSVSVNFAGSDGSGNGNGNSNGHSNGNDNGNGNGNGNDNGNGNGNSKGNNNGNTNGNSNGNSNGRDGTKQTTAPTISFDGSTKAVTSKFAADSLKLTLDQATANDKGVKRIKIDVPQNAAAKQYVQILPTAALSANTKNAEIEIKTDVATITVPSNMLNKGDVPSSDIGLRIAKVSADNLQAEVRDQIGNHPVIELNLQSGDRVIPWNNIRAPVTVSVPYTPTGQELQNPEHIVIWYVDGTGKITAIPRGKYDPTTGSVSFKTTHFSTYAIAYSGKSFDDLESALWAKKRIEVMASKGIVNGISDTAFEPSQAISRADFLVLAVRTLDLQGELGARFADVPDDAYYNEPLRIARGLGIVDGIGDNKFMPLEPITREDMMVLAARALEQTGDSSLDANSAAVHQFTDVIQMYPYAVSRFAELVNGGLVHGYDQALHPKATTTRAEAAVLLYNIYNH